MTLCSLYNFTFNEVLCLTFTGLRILHILAVLLTTRGVTSDISNNKTGKHQPYIFKNVFCCIEVETRKLVSCIYRSVLVTFNLALVLNTDMICAGSFTITTSVVICSYVNDWVCIPAFFIKQA